MWLAKLLSYQPEPPNLSSQTRGARVTLERFLHSSQVVCKAIENGGHVALGDLVAHIQCQNRLLQVPGNRMGDWE